MKMSKTALTIAISAAMMLPSLVSAASHKKIPSKSTAQQVEAGFEKLKAKLKAELRTELKAELEAEQQQLRNQITATRTEAKSNLNAVVAQTQAKEAAQDAEIAKDEAPNSRLFFRGGYSALTHNVTANNTFVGQFTAPTNTNQAGSGWDVGVGLEHGLTDNIWGLTEALSLSAELGILYNHYGSINGVRVLAPPGTSGGGVSVDQLQITAAPKIRVNNLGGFSPWVIPIGLAIGVIGTPSAQATYVTPGLVLGTGLDYDITDHIFAGFDFRYQFYGNNLSQFGNSSAGQYQASLDGFQTNANVGFKF